MKLKVSKDRRNRAVAAKGQKKGHEAWAVEEGKGEGKVRPFQVQHY